MNKRVTSRPSARPKRATSRPLPAAKRPVAPALPSRAAPVGVRLDEPAPFSRPRLNLEDVPVSSAQIEAAFCFMDLAGFTLLTEAQGDEDAANLATRFAELTRRCLERGDRLVKTIGDAVLVTSPNAAQGIELAERVFTAAGRDPSFPPLRAGLHYGPAVRRDGDVFGAAVNLAARVSAEAYAGELLGTAPIAAAARALNIPVAELGSVPLKNVREPTPLFSLALVVGTADTPIDPVCQNPVDRRAAAGRLRFQDSEYWFCSLTCAAAFASNPSWHATDGKPKG